MGRDRLFGITMATLAIMGAAWLGLATRVAWAGDGQITMTSVEAILQQNSLQPGGPTAKVVGSCRAGNSELQVIEMSKIKLHHHDQMDHSVYIARGRGILRMGEKGQEIREVKPGDLIAGRGRGAPQGCSGVRGSGWTVWKIWGALQHASSPR